MIAIESPNCAGKIWCRLAKKNKVRNSVLFKFYRHQILLATFRPGGGILYIFWVRGRAIGKGIDFHDFGIRNGIDFHDFGIRNGIDVRNFAIGIGSGMHFRKIGKKSGIYFI